MTKQLRYGQFYADFMHSMKILTRSEVMVYITLCWFANPKRLAWPTASTIAALTGHTRQQVGRCLSKLKLLGLIRQHKRTGRFVIYQLNNPEMQHPGVPSDVTSRCDTNNTLNNTGIVPHSEWVDSTPVRLFSSLN